MNPEKLKQLQEQVRIGGKVKSWKYTQKNQHVYILGKTTEYSINFLDVLKVKGLFWFISGNNKHLQIIVQNTPHFKVNLK